MNKKPILTVDIAINLREKGLYLPTILESDPPRLREIALRMHELSEELNKLDQEILNLKNEKP
jgi:hypothetical protein